MIEIKSKLKEFGKNLFWIDIPRMALEEEIIKLGDDVTVFIRRNKTAF